MILPAILMALAGLALLWSRRLSFPVRLSLLGHVGFWGLLPFLYRLAVEAEPTGAYSERWYGIAGWIHALGISATVLLAVAVPSTLVFRVRPGLVSRWRVNDTVVSIGMPLFALAVMAARMWQFRTAGGDFVSLVSVNISRERETLGGVTLVSSIATSYFSLALATLLMGELLSLRSRIIAWICLTVMALLHGLLFGMRAMLLLPAFGLFILAAGADPARRRSAWLFAWGGALGTAGVVPFAASILGMTRFTGSMRLDAEVAGAAVEALSQLSSGDRMRLFAAAANTKFDDISTAASLLAMDGPGGGGLRPLTSALFSPFPRLLLPSKPVPTSFNGEQSGVPYVRAAAQYGTIETGMVVPVSAVSVTVWELGWIGVVLFVLVNALMLWRLDSWVKSCAILPTAFAFSMLSFPIFEFTLEPPSALVRDALRLGVVWAGLALIFLLAQGRRGLTVDATPPEPNRS
jgi:hypothetical protein